MDVGLHETCISLPPGGVPQNLVLSQVIQCKASNQDTRANFLANTEDKEQRNGTHGWDEMGNPGK